jgi:CheY-like chemotaxis protein
MDPQPNRRPIALVVDGDPDTRQMYGEFLRWTNWAVIEAEDGREALAKAIAERPDVIVADTRLPGMSGIDLCRLLRLDPETSATPIVFVTADARDAERARTTRGGADAVVVKPCLPEQMAKVIHEVSEARRAAADDRLQPAPTVHGTAPTVRCPMCDRPLKHIASHMGGVAARPKERWDDFECAGGCGRFVYRHRTRKLRRAR